MEANEGGFTTVHSTHILDPKNIVNKVNDGEWASIKRSTKWFEVHPEMKKSNVRKSFQDQNVRSDLIHRRHDANNYIQKRDDQLFSMTARKTTISVMCNFQFYVDKKRDGQIKNVHFLIPSTVNLLSAIFLITTKSRQQLRLQKNRSYGRILGEQYQEHRHLLLAPIALVLLALPRLSLTFFSKCMQSSDDAWLYVVLYFISFIPTMLTFVVFIIPSKFYQKEFGKSMTEYRTMIRRRLHPIETTELSLTVGVV